MHKWYRKYWNSDIKTYTTPDNDTPEDCPHGGRRFARTGDRAPERRTDRGGARPHEIRHHGHRPPPPRLALHSPRRTRVAGRQERFFAHGGRRAQSVRLRPDHHPRHARRGRQTARLPRHDGRPLFVVLDDLVGHHFRQDHHQAHRSGAGYQPRPRDFPPQGRNGRPGQGGRGVRTAALHQAQRQRQLVRRDESPYARRGAARHRGGLRPKRRGADRRVHRGP